MKKAQLSTAVALVAILLLGTGVIILSEAAPNIIGATTFEIEGITVNPIPTPFVWDEDTNYTFIISDYFTDLEGDQITYSDTGVNNITIVYTYNTTRSYSMTENISWYGEQPSALLGAGNWDRGVNYAGDFNGDGYDDILIGSYPYNSSSGIAYLVYGPAVFSDPNITYANVSFHGENSNAYAGASLSSAGDFNGDGYDDILIGSWEAYQGTVPSGKAYLIYGRPDLSGMFNLSNVPTSVVNVTFYGNASGDKVGRSVSNAGDLNNDGYDDILIGAPNVDNCGSDDGIVYLVFGRPSLEGSYNLTNQNIVNASFCGGKSQTSAGLTLRKTEDINKDGHKDLIIGAFLSDNYAADAGEIFVVYGPFTSGTYDYNLSSTADVSFYGENQTDEAGISIGSGDFNGDGYEDILIGAARADHLGTMNTGKVYLIYGESSLSGAKNLSDTSVIDTVIYGETPQSSLGISVSSVGDIDNDGFDDFILGSLNINKVYLVFGRSTALPSLINASDTTVINVTWSAQGGFGGFVSNAGDYDNDGIEDILVSAFSNDTNRGRVYLIYGNRTSVEPANATLVPDPNFNTDSMADPGVIFYANSTGDGDWNWEGPVILHIDGINDYPAFSGVIPNFTFGEDTNTSINVTSYFNDVEDGRNITYTVNTSSNFNTAYSYPSGNLTFSPIADWTGWEVVIVNATDSDGATTQSNLFILNVLPAADNLTNIANISNLTWPEDTVYQLNLSDYFYDSDSTTVYGYDSPTRPMYITTFVNSTTGYTTLTPDTDWYGDDTINFTATELDTDINFSQRVYLNVTEVTDELRYNLTNTIQNVTLYEDTYNDSINLSQHFYYPPEQTVYYTYNYTRNKMICHFDSGDVCSNQIINSTNVSFSAGYFDEAYDFDGNTSFVEVNHSSGLDFSTFSEFTVEAWIRPSSNVTTNMYILSRNITVHLLLDAADRPRATLYNTTGVYGFGSSTPVLVNNWTHIALVYNGTTAFLYQDTALVATQLVPNLNDSLESVYIGNVNNLTFPFNGSIDEVRILSYAKSAEEINRTYKYEYPVVNVNVGSDSIVNLTGSTSNIAGIDYIEFIIYNSSGESNSSGEIFVNFTSVNDLPLLNNTISDQEWIKDSNQTFSLQNFFYDIEGQNLTYNSSITGSGITVIINQTTLNVTLVPASGWYGTEYLVITANDTQNVTNSNNVTLTVYELNNIIVITPSTVQNGTIPITYILSNFQNTTVSVNATYSTDSGLNFSRAAGDSLTNLSTYNISENLAASSDAYIDSANSSDNYDSETFIEAGSYGTRKVRSLLKFNIPFIANSSFIRNATLKLFQTYAVGETRTLGICAPTTDWYSSNVTYSNQPSSASCIDNVSIDNTLEYKTWNITSLVKQWVDSSSTNYGIMLKDINEPNSIGLHSFASSEYGGNSTPQIVMYYKGNQYTFYWESISDVGYTYQSNVRINITELSTGSVGGTLDFTVDNNNPPSINTTISETIIMYEDVPKRIDAADYFYDLNNHSMAATFTQGVNVTVSLVSDETSTEFTVSDATDYQGKPKIVIDSDDNRYFVWQDLRDGNYDIYMAKFNSSNSKIFETRVTNLSSDQSEPDVAIDPEDNKYLVWTDTRNGNKDIYLAKYNSSDVLQYNISVDTNTTDQAKSTIAYDNGKLYVFWEQTAGSNTVLSWIFLNSSDGDNVTSLNSTSGSWSITEPNIVVDSTGNKHLVDIENDNQTTWVLWNSTDDQPSFAYPASDSYRQSHPSAAADTLSNEIIYITWADSNNVSNYSNIKLTKWNVTSSSAITSVNVTTGQTPRFNPEVAVDADGDVYVVYENHLNSQADIYFAKYDQHLNLTYTRSITTNNQTQSVPAIAIDSDDKKIIVWQHRGTSDDLKAIELSQDLTEILLTPDANFYGNDSFVLIMNDSYNATNRTLNITVIAVNDAPVLASGIPAITWIEDGYNDSLNLSAYFTDVEGDNMTYSAIDPQNIDVSINTSTTEVNFTSDTNFSGTRYTVFTATDGMNSSDSNNITLTVIDVNDAPDVDFSSINPTQLAEDNFNDTISLSSYVTDIDDTDAEINWSCSGNETDVTITENNSTKILNISATNNFTGSVNVTCIANDTNATDTDSFIVNVVPVNDVPVLNLSNLIANQTIQIGNNATVTLSNHFYDVDGDDLGFTVTSVQNISITIDNSTDTATISSDASFSGARYVVFTAYDGVANATSNNVTINYTAITSEFINTYVNGSGPYNGNFSNITGTFNSTLLDSNITGDESSINYSTIRNTTATSSYIISSEINTSTINNSDLSDCTVVNSTVKNYLGTNCTILNSEVDPPTPSSRIVGSNITGNSNITTSNVTSSDVDNSNITNSNITGCDIDGSVVFNSIISGCNLTNVNLTDDTVYNGTITCLESTYDADASGPTGLVNITNYAPTASFNVSTASTTTGTVIEFNGSASSDPNIPGLLNQALNYSWDFGDGNTTNTTSAFVNHSYSSAGTYNPVLTVIDNSSASDTETLSITISTTGGGSSGGGGGGGSSRAVTSCTESWICEDWGPCGSTNLQHRECRDNNSCGTITSRPGITKSCTYVPTCSDRIQNQDETGVDCGGTCPACPGTPPEPIVETPVPPPEPTVPPPEPEPKLGMKLIAIILLSIFIVVGLSVGGGVAVSRHRHFMYIDAAKNAIKETLKQGYNEDDIRDSMVRTGWHKPMVNQAIREVNVDILQRSIKRNISRGAKKDELMVKMLEKGWPKSIIKEAFKGLDIKKAKPKK